MAASFAPTDETWESLGIPMAWRKKSVPLIQEIGTLRDTLTQIMHTIKNTSPEEGQNQNLAQSSLESELELMAQFEFLGACGGISELPPKWPMNAEQVKDSIETSHAVLRSILNRWIMEDLRFYLREAQFYQKLPHTPTIDLDDLQELAEQIYELIFGLESVVDAASTHLDLSHVQTALEGLLYSLLKHGFIIDLQPPQILKVNTRFANLVRLRWLLGSKFVTMGGTLGIPKVEIISEQQAYDVVSKANSVLDLSPKSPDKLKDGKNSLIKPCGFLEGNRSNMEFKVSDNGGVSVCYANFKFLLLKKIDREIKKVKNMREGHSPTKPTASSPLNNTGIPPSVTDEKFCLRFELGVSFRAKSFNIWALSIPTVVVTHGGQESHGWGTIMWDNCFSLATRLPYEVPDRVSWSSVADILNYRFALQTGRGLDVRQLRVLRTKIAPDLESKSDGEASITFARFAKEVTISGLPFWAWFYACLKLTEKHMLNTWRSGLVYGFVKRGDAERMLTGKKAGTFILRFSDTVLGGLSVCYTAMNGEAYSLSPLTTRNLSFRSLTDTLWDLSNLTTLYPSSPKEDAFPQHHQESLPFNVKALGEWNPQGAGPSSSASISDSIYVPTYPRISIPDQFI